MTRPSVLALCWILSLVLGACAAGPTSLPDPDQAFATVTLTFET